VQKIKYAILSILGILGLLKLKDLLSKPKVDYDKKQADLQRHSEDLKGDIKALEEKRKNIKVEDKSLEQEIQYWKNKRGE
jgi:septal ring factor EnvC (AmiA/AmiB activator)